MAFLPRCVKAGTSALSHGDLSDFLNKTKNLTFGFFTVKISNLTRFADVVEYTKEVHSL
jgi:hypothetical protein